MLEQFFNSGKEGLNPADYNSNELLKYEQK